MINPAYMEGYNTDLYAVELYNDEFNMLKSLDSLPPQQPLRSSAQRPSGRSRRVLCCFGAILICVLAVGVIGSILPALLGPEINEQLDDEPQRLGQIQLTINGHYYNNGQTVSLPPGSHSVQCSFTDSNSINELQLSFQSFLLWTQQFSRSIDDGYVHTAVATIDLTDVGSSNLLICTSSESISTSVYVTVVDTDLEIEPPEQSNIQLFIDGSNAAQNSYHQLDRGHHEFRCLVSSTDSDVEINWSLDNVAVYENSRTTAASYEDSGGIYIHESTFSLDVILLTDTVGVISCAAITSTGMVYTVDANLRTGAGDTRLQLWIDDVTYNDGEVNLDEGTYTFRCTSDLLSPSNDPPIVWMVDSGLVSEQASYTTDIDWRDCRREFQCMIRDEPSTAREIVIVVGNEPTSAVFTVHSQSQNTATIRGSGSVLEVVNGTVVNLQCTANGGDGDPSVTITLYRNILQMRYYEGSEDDIDCVAQSVTRDFSFVASYSDDHSKELVCSAGDVEHRLVVDITVPPSSSKMYLSLDGNRYQSGSSIDIIGTEHELNCTVSDTRPTADISWEIGERSFQADDEVVTIASTELVSASSVRTEQVAGSTRVSCTAANGVSTDESASIYIDLVVHCEVPPTIDNGAWDPPGSIFPHGTTVTYACAHGYILEGDTQTECTEDGLWSNDPPTCCQSSYTPDLYQYQYVWPMIPEDVTSFTFRIRGSNDVHVGLSSTNADVANMYEIVLGGWGNTRSAIRLSMQGATEVWPFTNGILSGTEYREFRIGFANDFIEVSRVGESPFMSFQNPASFDVAYIGITTGYGGEGDWLFCGFDE